MLDKMVPATFSDPTTERRVVAAVDAVFVSMAAAGLTIDAVEVGDVVEADVDGIRVRIDVTSRTSVGSAQRDVAWVAQVGGGAPPATVAVATSAGPMGMWWYPDDPRLPGLRSAVTPGGLAHVLGAFDTDTGVRPDTEVVTYLPLHQAVVRVGAPVHRSDAVGDVAFVRVVPPDDIDHVVTTLARCRTAGVPVPEVVATDRLLGLVVTAALPGSTLRDRLVDGRPMPDAQALWSLMEAISCVDVDRPTPVESLPASIERHAARLAAVAPDLADRIDALARRLTAFTVAPEVVVIHGDLHDRQILVDADGAITGVLDVDEVGRGDLLDDLGRLVAHAAARGCTGEVASGRADRVVEDWLVGFGSFVDPDQLRHRSAAALLGLAHGPWRTGQPDALGSIRRAVSVAEALVPA